MLKIFRTTKQRETQKTFPLQLQDSVYAKFSTFTRCGKKIEFVIDSCAS